MLRHQFVRFPIIDTYILMEKLIWTLCIFKYYCHHRVCISVNKNETGSSYYLFKVQYQQWVSESKLTVTVDTTDNHM